jgi:hypothetical protein
LEDIWVNTFKKSSGICSIFVSAWGNVWGSMVWSLGSDSVSDWLLILKRRCCNMAESFYWAFFRDCNSDLRVLISECNSGTVTVVLDFLLLRIFVRSKVLVLVEGNTERFGGLEGRYSGLLKSFNSLSK